MKMKYIALALAGAMLAGCSSTSNKLEDAKRADCYFDGTNEEAPRWICAIPNDLPVGAIGLSRIIKGMPSITRTRAEEDGRVRLARKFENNVSTLYKESTSGKITPETAEATTQFENAVKTVTSRTLTNTKVYNHTTCKENNTMYVLVGMDQATYDANMKKTVDSLQNEDSQLWNKFNSEKAAASLQQTLDTMKANLNADSAK